MQILIGCAKDMRGDAAESFPLVSTPLFQEEAVANVLQMRELDEEQLVRMLKCTSKIAKEVRGRYLSFFDEEGALPAAMAYNGVVFRHLQAETFSSEELVYAQSRLWITSFLYGLLRPADLIHPYRMEGSVRLPDNGCTMFEFWKPRLTEVFISSIQRSGGVLLDLASKEMRRLFDWKKVKASVQVVSPEFLVRKGDRLKTVTIYAKMCRGAMTRWVLDGRMEDAALWQDFSFEGFQYNPAESTPDTPLFIMEDK